MRSETSLRVYLPAGRTLSNLTVDCPGRHCEWNEAISMSAVREIATLRSQ
jgi:hypothetical protein